MNKTILQVVPNLCPGGVERGTMEIAKAIVANGHNSLFLSSGGTLVPKAENNGSRHLKLNVASHNPLVIFANINRMTEIVKHEHVDIVHAHSRAPAWSAYYAARKSDVPFITSIHGLYDLSSTFSRLYSGIMLKGDKIIAVSNYIKNHILKNYNITSDKIEVVHGGIDCQKIFNPELISEEIKESFKKKYHTPKNTPIIVLPARVMKSKGHHILIKALSLLNHLDFYCIISGDLSKYPAYACEIRNMIAKFKMQKKIRLFGTEMDMKGLYAISDIVLSPSIEPEALGTVALEAQSMERIVIASDIGGSLENIIDQKTGYHFKSGDQNALAEKIEFVLQNLDSPSILQIKQHARQNIIDNFSLDLMKKTMLKIYQDI